MLEGHCQAMSIACLSVTATECPSSSSHSMPPLLLFKNTVAEEGKVCMVGRRQEKRQEQAQLQHSRSAGVQGNGAHWEGRSWQGQR